MKKVQIQTDNKMYTLEIDRATAMEISKELAGNDKIDSFTQIEIVIKHALKKNHSDLNAEQISALTKFICDEYNLVDFTDESGKIIKGLMAILNEMIEVVIPRGFMGKATRKFVVVD